MNLFCSPSWNKKCKLLRAQLKTDSVCKLSHRGAVWGDLRRFCFTCLLIFVCCTSPCSSTILSWIYCFFWITHNLLFYTAKNSLQFCQMAKDLYFKWLNVTYQQRNSPLFWGHAKGKLGWPVLYGLQGREVGTMAWKPMDGLLTASEQVVCGMFSFLPPDFCDG